MLKISLFKSTSFLALCKIFFLLQPSRKVQILFALLLIFISALFELLTVVFAAPLILLVQGQDIALSMIFDQIPLLHLFALNQSAYDFSSYVFFFAVLVFLSAGFRIYNSYFSGYIAALVSTDISTSAYIHIYNQAFEKLLAKSFGYYSSLLTSYTDNISLTLTFVLQGISGLVASVFIIIGLLMIDYPTTLFILLILAFTYIAILISSKRRLSGNSKSIAEKRVIILQKLNESFSLSRQIMLASRQGYYTDSYLSVERSLRKKLAENIFIGNFPRFIVESFGLMLIAFCALYLSITSKSDLAFAIIGSTALGLQRLLPSFQQVYTGLSILRSHETSLSEIFQYASPRHSTHSVFNTEFRSRAFRQLDFCNVCYRYPGSNKDSLSDLSFTVKAGDSIGLLGPTGSGKSTFIELLSGLRSPSSGQILLDGQDLHLRANHDLKKCWHSQIAYVPQKTFVSNSTIAENIALGIPRTCISDARLKLAASQACLLEFIESCPLGFDTVVGESGWALSGGQVQRLGLARAFYMRPNLVILDEVTSALDLQTEASVISSLSAFHASGVTLISVAHRPAALSICNKLYELPSGSIIT